MNTWPNMGASVLELMSRPHWDPRPVSPEVQCPTRRPDWTGTPSDAGSRPLLPGSGAAGLDLAAPVTAAQPSSPPCLLSHCHQREAEFYHFLFCSGALIMLNASYCSALHGSGRPHFSQAYHSFEISAEASTYRVLK